MKPKDLIESIDIKETQLIESAPGIGMTDILKKEFDKYISNHPMIDGIIEYRGFPN